MQDCTQVSIDGRRSTRPSDYGVYDGSISPPNSPISSELKDEQWLGVEVKSNGDKVIVCAHRYTIRVDDLLDGKQEDTKRGMIGLCYILDADLKVQQSTAMGYKNVMVIRDVVDGKKQKPKEGFDDHAKWGVCQVGASVSFVDDEAFDDEALFGAPGCFTWRGNLIARTLDSLQPYEAVVNDDTYLGYAKHGMMGVSVASGRFFDDILHYASGAPHAEASGHVYFFARQPSSGVLQPRPELTLRGEDYGAAFGLSLAACNVNGDSSPDLLVGAPFYDDNNQGGGAVYAFFSKNGLLSQSRRLKIIGKELLGQFGLAISCMGDMNGDGYQDFGVGAPYEESGGSVYIFLGGRYLNMVERAEVMASQVITASSMSAWFPAGLSTFGASLSGGQDMDGNGYPDLLVGAFASSATFLFRARPIVDISTFVDDKNLRGMDPGKSGCSQDEASSDACFGFAACFKITQELRSTSHALRYLIEAEPHKPLSRMYLRLADQLDSSSSERNSSVEGTVVIESDLDNHQCIQLVGYVGATHLDLQTPVQFQMSYSLVQKRPSLAYNQGQALPSLDDYPILNQAGAKRKFQATFEKDCGEDEVCKSHLVINPSLWDAARELGRTPTGDSYELELGSLVGSELLLNVEVANKMEPAYEAKLDIFFPPALQYIGLSHSNDSNDVVTADVRNATWLSFTLGNPFKSSSQLQLRFQPQPSMEDKLIVFYMTANTSSELLFDASTFLQLAIVRRAEVKVMGSAVPELLHFRSDTVLGENAFDDLSQVGPPLVHKFLVINNGPSQLDVLSLHIRWPFQVENGQRQGKWLLYLSEHPSLKNGRGVCYLPAGIVANPLNLTSTMPEKYVLNGGSSPSKRQRRSHLDEVWVEKVVAPRTVATNDGRDLVVITLDCDRGTAKCLDIRCDVFNLPVQVPATVEVRSRLWNSTLAEDYGSTIDLVEVFTKAEIELDGDISQYIGDDLMR